MKNKKSKFNSLTSDVLVENNKIYTEALDYVFSNNNIKNIAITGIYGAGKSTVWNTYVNQKKLEEIITVSLGTYRDIGNKNDESIALDNRVEMQLINQILAQIKTKKIPLSKYRFKSNKNLLSLIFQSVLLVSIVCSILLWITKDTILYFIRTLNPDFNGISLIFLCALMMIFPLFFYFFMFNKENKIRISKINFKGAEANVNDIEISDESVFDKNIKELVYLLRSSGSKIVVFEDLDRYDNASIYMKLRELNFLLNKYVELNDDKDYPVRFIYMLKDGLFFSKNRTKFFDFILPIVPVIDSKTSENELIELLKQVEEVPDRGVIADISLYVDDMRLLKNIVNEFIVYSKVIPLGQLDLESNKLFALITLKNIFPNEFDLLQEDRGFIRSVFDEIDKNKKNLLSNFDAKISKINENIRFLNNRIANDKFEAMALMIRSDVSNNSSELITWAEYLRDWSLSPDTNKSIKYSGGTTSLNYHEFLSRYIFYNEENKKIIEKFPVDYNHELNNLKYERKQIEKQTKDIDIYNYKDVILSMTAEQRDELFAKNKNPITEDHYFPLIRFLIVEGLLDETYWYYKGNFNVSTSNTLKRNDIIYIKGLKEGKKLDIFLDLETPNEVIKRLKSSEFRRNNILNKSILKTCIDGDYREYLFSIIDSVIANNNFEDLVRILDDLELINIQKFIDILLNIRSDAITDILKYCYENSANTLKNILISILTNRNIRNLDDFKSYIEENESLISHIPEEQFDDFIKNISISNIKFTNLYNSNASFERLVKIEAIGAYCINVENVIYITERILNKKIAYGNLLDVIFQSANLKATSNFVNENWIDFLPEYINKNTIGEIFNNSEKILIKVINSSISEDNLISYIENNSTIISELSSLNSTLSIKFLNCLLKHNLIRFTSNNLSEYWNRIDKYNMIFIKYIEENIDDMNYMSVLEDNISICNSLINDPDISYRLFMFVINFTDENIDEIDPKLDKDKITKIVERDLLTYNVYNIEFLLSHRYYKEIESIVSSKEIEVEEKVIDILLDNDLSEELIYLLINSSISDDNALKLIDLRGKDILIEKINNNKEVIIKEIISREISAKNIKYIASHFEKFRFKDEFIQTLEKCGELKLLDNDVLNKNIMLYILCSDNVSIGTKLYLIIIKINNNLSIELIKEYINFVPEIKNITTVWNRKRPILENAYQIELSNVLLKKSIIKRYGEKRIELIKK